MPTWFTHAVSQVLLWWHWLISAVIPERFVGTSWTWALSICCLAASTRLVLLTLSMLLAGLWSGRPIHHRSRGTGQYARHLQLALHMACFFSVVWIFRRMQPTQLNTTAYGWTDAEWRSALQADFISAPLGAKLSLRDPLHDDAPTSVAVAALILACAVAVHLAGRCVACGADSLRIGPRWVWLAVVGALVSQLPVGAGLYLLALMVRRDPHRSLSVHGRQDVAV